MKRGRAGTMTHDYLRNGTTTLFAALNVLDGSVTGQCMQRHRHQGFVRFLNRLERDIPAGKTVHVILDNYARHKHPKATSTPKPQAPQSQSLARCSGLQSSDGGLAIIADLGRIHGPPRERKAISALWRSGHVQPSIRPCVAALAAAGPDDIRSSVPYHVSGLRVRCAQRVRRSSVRPDLPSTTVLPAHSSRVSSAYAAAAGLID